MLADSTVPKRVIALQAITPDALAAELGCALGEARKIVSMVHRDKPLAPSDGGRRHRNGPHPARARGSLLRLRELPGGLRARVCVLRDRTDGAAPQPGDVGDRRAGPRREPRDPE